MAYDQTDGAGEMWRLDADGSATRVLTGLTVSNGLAWTPDGSRTYFVDSPTLRVDLLHVDPATGDVEGREPFTTVTDGPGVPDGLVLDAEGGVWVAVNGEGAVVRYDASGAVTERVEVPVPAVTACTLGGPDLSTLYATTSTQGVDTSAHPAAGSVFALAVGVRGLPPLPCAA
jgi:sugar lactone lactonase YvrE